MRTNFLPVVGPLRVNGPLMAVFEPDQQVYVRAALDAHHASLLPAVRVVGVDDGYLHK